MMTVQRITIPADGTLELSRELLRTIGLEAGDELVVIQTPDGFFIGPRERVLTSVLSDLDANWNDTDLSLEAFLARRPTIAAALLKQHYGIKPDERTD